MSDVTPQDTLNCTQCGGELHPDEGQIFLTCPYCSSTVYVDKSQVVFHWYLASTLDEGKAQSSLARWMGGNQTVKDLDRKSRLVETGFEYFPIWYFKRRRDNGGEEILIEPAAATSVSELRSLNLPAGDLRKYDPSLDKQAHDPTVPLSTALNWLQERGIAKEEISEQSLVHLPLYTIKYTYNGNTYTAVVEAGTGGVFANIYPEKAEAPYMVAGAATAVVFLCLALFPLAGALIGASAFGISFLLCAGLGIIAAPLLFALAMWVAAKV